MLAAIQNTSQILFQLPGGIIADRIGRKKVIVFGTALRTVAPLMLFFARSWQLVVTVLLVALPVLIYPYLNPASTLLVLFSIVAGTLTMVAMLLWLFGIWLPVATILLFQLQLSWLHSREFECLLLY